MAKPPKPLVAPRQTESREPVANSGSVEGPRAGVARPGGSTLLMRASGLLSSFSRLIARGEGN